MTSLSSEHPVKQTFPIGAQWPTVDPFLFVAHHNDAYPASDGHLRPDAPLADRALGNDFSGLDGWSMYHGHEVPGFPQHPHRGFETVTYVRQGIVDHADSLGATARFGRGDTQWMTAGAGIQHAEMFPLLDETGPNPLELFQIWLNLPADDKMVDPYFTMLWDHDTPTITTRASSGAICTVTVIAGRLGDSIPAAPPPDSWASKAESDLAIWHFSFEPGAAWDLAPARGPETQRTLYVFEGDGVTVDGSHVAGGTGAVLDASTPCSLQSAEGAECVLLQGRPIGEPVAQHGPFVMNSAEEVQQTFADYQRTQFGGWPWPSPAPDHGTDKGRFARHVDGRVEEVE